MDRLGPLALAATCAALALGTRLVAAEQKLAANSYEDTYYVPPPVWLPWMTVGYDEALADLLWCRALIYQGEEFAHTGAMVHVFSYGEAMLALDPDFRAVYVWLGTAGLYQPDGASAEEMRLTVEYLRRGRDRFPEDGDLAWLLGSTLAFEVAPHLPEAERESTRLEGVEHLMDAARLGAAPDWLVLSNTSNLASLGQAERAAQHLEEMYAIVSDETVRAEIATRIHEIRNDAYGDAFVDANDRLELERARRYPYLSPDLYFLIAPSPEEDRTRTLREGFGPSVIADDTADGAAEP